MKPPQKHHRLKITRQMTFKVTRRHAGVTFPPFDLFALDLNFLYFFILISEVFV